MKRLYSVLVGFGLIALGVLALVGTVVFPGLQIKLDWRVLTWFWPLLIIGLGLTFMALPILVRRRGMGALFIPGTLVLTNGLILFTTNLTGLWEWWEFLWPLEVLSLAAGFLLAAVYMRSVWLSIPAIIIGLNGAVLWFCALTGWWESWSVLWTVEPLAVGLVLLVIGFSQRVKLLILFGLLLCGFAGVAFISGGLIVLIGWDYLLYAWPVSIILIGAFVLLWGLSRSPSPPALASE